MIINTNMGSVNALNNLSANGTTMQKALEKLSSGQRINRASDDAAGLAISEKMRGQIRGLNQAQRNAQDGISLLQTAEGALNETHSILQRMRELAVEGANDTLSDSDREAVGTEMTQLSEEVTRISASTKFNGAGLLDGSFATGKTLQIGANQADATLATSDQTLSIVIDKSDAVTLGVDGLGAGLATASDAAAAITSIDDAISTISDTRASIGATQNRLEHAITNLSTSSENMQASESRIRDVDMAKAMSDFTKNQILNQAGVSVLAQANQTPQSVLKLLG